MKRYLIAALLIIVFSNSSCYSDELENSPVMNVQDAVFRSSLTDLVPDTDGNGTYSGYDSYSFDDNGRSYKEVDPDNMPFFKQMRLTITNKLLATGNDSEENKSKESIINKIKFWKNTGCILYESVFGLFFKRADSFYTEQSCGCIG